MTGATRSRHAAVAVSVAVSVSVSVSVAVVIAPPAAATEQAIAGPPVAGRPIGVQPIDRQPAAGGRAVTVVDDAGTPISLPTPAQRIVSLAPHATELIYAAGGGDRLVGAVDFSDYPPAALRVPRVGSNTALDLERIAALKPDLIVVWLHGNPARQLTKLRALGIPLFYSQPRKLADIAPTLDRLGTLMDTLPAAQAAGRAFDARIAALHARYEARAPVSVFYQVWSDPLMTLNDTHIISDVIRLCGGRNVFGTLTPLVPTVSTEAVLAANPDAIVTARVRPTKAIGAAAIDAADLDRWRAWPRLTAVAQGNLFAIDADLIDRPTPRLAMAAQQMCTALDQARTHAATQRGR